MKEISMTKGIVSIVDDEDFYLVSQYKWYPEKRKSGYYAISSKSNGKSIRMHRLIMNAPQGMCVDHVNGDTLDNRRENLRVCTVAQNSWNAKKSKFNNSGYKCVVWKDNAWRVQFTVNGKMYRIGPFKTPSEAHEVYKQKAKEYYGEYARFE